jgi:hypothetical protein
VRGISLVLTDGQLRVRLFVRAFTMSVLQASGVYLIAHGSLWAGLTGFLISYHWIGAARDGVDHRVPWARVWYGIGGGFGALLVMLTARLLG